MWEKIHKKQIVKKFSGHERNLTILWLSSALFGLYMKFGVGTELLYYGMLFCILVVVSVIDMKTCIIPNRYIIIGSIWGITFNVLGRGIDIGEGIFGAIAGGLSILSLSLLSLLLFQKPGMGGGDIKLMAMAGLFLGWRLILLAILIAIYIAGASFLVMMARKEIGADDYMPFGPYLALGIIISLLFGDYIIKWYMDLF